MRCGSVEVRSWISRRGKKKEPEKSIGEDHQEVHHGLVMIKKHHGRHHEKSSLPRSHVENVRGYAVDEVSGDIYEKEVAKDSRHVIDDLRDEGLKEDEVEHFLHSRYHNLLTTIADLKNVCP